MKKIVVLLSGSGTNLQAIIGAIENGVLPNVEISAVISNRKNSGGLEKAKNHNIYSVHFPKPKEESRESYDHRLADIVSEHKPDLIVLAGWMRILTNRFINKFRKGSVINLHPALPGEYPGADGIGDAFKAFMEGKQTRTGVMVHEVVEEIDAGKVIETQIIPILPDDTLEILRDRVRAHEKLPLINAIYKKLYTNLEKDDNNTSQDCCKIGKVRNMRQVQNFYFNFTCRIFQFRGVPLTADRR